MRSRRVWLPVPDPDLPISTPSASLITLGVLLVLVGLPVLFGRGVVAGLRWRGLVVSGIVRVHDAIHALCQERMREANERVVRAATISAWECSALLLSVVKALPCQRLLDHIATPGYSPVVCPRSCSPPSYRNLRPFRLYRLYAFEARHELGKTREDVYRKLKGCKVIL